MNIKYVGKVLELGGEGESARGYIRAISRDKTLLIENMGRDESSWLLDKPEVIRGLSNELPYEIVVHHLPPPEIKHEPKKINIGIVSCKTSRIPQSWVLPCNKLDLIITPTTRSRVAVETASVYTPIVVIPPPIDTDHYRPRDPLAIDANIPPIRLLTIFTPRPSSNWVDVIMSYLTTLQDRKDVVLIAKTRSKGVAEAIVSMSGLVEDAPLIYAITNSLNEDAMPSLYSTADVLLLPARGKDFGMCYYHSVACGTPVVCSDSTGLDEYLPPITFEAIPSEIYPATSSPSEPYYNEERAWSRPVDLQLALDRALVLAAAGRRISNSIPSTLSFTHVADQLGESMDNLIKSKAVKKEEVPDVSIIILSYNNLEMLRRCIYKISEVDPGPVTYEVIVLDNGSDLGGGEPNDLSQYLDDIDKSGTRVFYSQKNLGFGPGNNKASMEARGRILLFLNNDTEPLDGWLAPIVKLLDEDPKVGVVGSKLLYPNHTIQHVGIAFKQAGEYYAAHPFNGEPYDTPMANVRREVRAVTGACLSIRSDLFREAGGFDPAYEVGYYEDSALCMTIRDMGYKIVMEPESVVIHKCGSSFSKLGHLRELWFYNDNERKFIETYHHRLTNDEILYSSKHYYKKNRMNVAILNSNMGTMGGGEKESACVALALESDNNVDLIIRHPNEVTHHQISQKLGISLNSTDIVTLISGDPIKNVRDYDLFWNNEWNSNQEGQGKFNALRVMFPHTHSDLQFLNSYDIILANSQYTARWIREYWGREAEVLYPPVDMMAEEWELEEIMDNKQNLILSVGRFFLGEHCKKHKVMIEAMRDIVDKGLMPGWELHLVGGVKRNTPDEDYYNECRELAIGYPIFFHTNASYDELRELYRKGRIYWHATGYGESNPVASEHFGITVVEAMSAGCYPVVIDKGGLRESCAAFSRWSTPQELIELTVNYKEFHSRFDAGGQLRGIAQRYSQESFLGAVKALIGGVQK